MSAIIRTIVLLLFFVAITGAQRVRAQATEYREEVRGVWVTNVASDVLHSKQKLADAMEVEDAKNAV